MSANLLVQMKTVFRALKTICDLKDKKYFNDVLFLKMFLCEHLGYIFCIFVLLLIGNYNRVSISDALNQQPALAGNGEIVHFWI